MNKETRVLKLVIGNKNYSSWSLRPWFWLKQNQIPFEEIRLPLFTDQWHREIGTYTPTRCVPVLVDDGFCVWESVAIIDYVLEALPTAKGWPADKKARATAQSVVAEMHSGFLALRAELPLNVRARCSRSLDNFSDAAQQQIQRIQTLWRDCHQHYGQHGPWMFGEFSIADAMYAPVALRFITYGVSVIPEAQYFMEAIQASKIMQQWIEAAIAEPERLPYFDAKCEVERDASPKSAQ